MTTRSGLPFERLFVLAPVSRRILSVALPDGAVSVFHEDAGPFPDGIALRGRTVWWTTMGEPAIRPGLEGEKALDFSASNGGIHALDLPSGRVSTALGRGRVTTPKQISIATDALYWCDREGASVSVLRDSSVAPEDLVRTGDGADPLNQCVGVAIDAEHGWLYWSQKGPADGGRGRIFRKPLRSSEAEAALLWDGLPEPIDLQIHDGYLYWTDRGLPPQGNTLNRASLASLPGRPGDPEILAAGFSEPIGLTIDPIASIAYVADLAGTISSVHLGAGERKVTTVTQLREPLTGIVGVNDLEAFA